MGVRKPGAASFEAESAETITVIVKRLTGEAHYFTASKRATIGKFRRRLAEHTGIPSDQVRLLCDGRRIQDSEHKLPIGDLAQPGDDAIEILVTLCLCGC